MTPRHQRYNAPAGIRSPLTLICAINHCVRVTRMMTRPVGTTWRDKRDWRDRRGHLQRGRPDNGFTPGVIAAS